MVQRRQTGLRMRKRQAEQYEAAQNIERIAENDERYRPSVAKPEDYPAHGMTHVFEIVEGNEGANLSTVHRHALSRAAGDWHRSAAPLVYDARVQPLPA